MTGFAFGSGFLERHRTGDLEGHFRGVDLVDLTVVDRGLDADHREAGEHAGFHGFLDTSLDGSDELRALMWPPVTLFSNS